MTVTINMHFNDKVWRRNGTLHNKYGPAFDYLSGTKIWYVNGLLHREDGPAKITVDGDKFWYQHGKLHRLNGPAVESIDHVNESWINGVEYHCVLEFLIEVEEYVCNQY